MSQGPESTNPLALGFYTVPEAARLLRAGSTRRLYGWLRGYAGRATGPLIARDFEPVGRKEEISFLDLMELRLVELLRKRQVRPRTIRKALVEARRVFATEKPFATDRILLKTDGKNVFVEEVLKKVAADEDDKRLWNLVTKQYEHYELIERTLLDGVEFDEHTHLARKWKPRPDAFPMIEIDPRVAYGKPATPSRVPTEAIYDLWLAEGESIGAVADWFDLPLDEVEMAVAFQRAMIADEDKAAA